MNEIEQIERNVDNLADIAWFLKGFMLGSDGDMVKCPFQRDHIQSLSDVMFDLRQKKEKMENTKA